MTIQIPVHDKPWTEAPPGSSEPLTWAQICEQYPLQWVALAEIDWLTRDNALAGFRTARVIVTELAVPRAC